MDIPIRTLGIISYLSLVGASMYAERGVGEYGIRFSHFCGPVVSHPNFPSGSLLQFSFGMNALRLKKISAESTTEETVMYHISRSHSPNQSMQDLCFPNFPSQILLCPYI